MRSSELTAHLLTHGKTILTAKNLVVNTKIKIHGTYVHMQDDTAMYLVSSALNVVKGSSGVPNGNNILITNNAPKLIRF